MIQGEMNKKPQSASRRARGLPLRFAGCAGRRSWLGHWCCGIHDGFLLKRGARAGTGVLPDSYVPEYWFRQAYWAASALS